MSDIFAGIAESHNTQYTADTQIQISKNLLKKLHIKNEVTRRASKEMINLYKSALERKNKSNNNVIEKIKYIEREPTITEQYRIFEKIKRKKEMENNKMTIRKREIEFEKENKQRIILQCNEKFKTCENEYNMFKMCYVKPIIKKKEILSIYKDLLDEKSNNSQNMINAYDMFMGYS